MKHTLSCMVRNRPGVIARLTKAFADKGINIESLAVAETEDTDVSRATVVVVGDDEVLSEAERQCEALDEVIGLEDLASEEFYARELLLVKVRVRPETITRIMQVAELFQARVIGLQKNTIALELSSDHRAIDGMLRMLRPLGIVAMARSGQIAISARDEIDEGNQIDVPAPSHVWRTPGPSAE